MDDNKISIDKTMVDEVCLTCTYWKIPVEDRPLCIESDKADCTCISFKKTKPGDTCALYEQHPKCKELVERIMDQWTHTGTTE